MASTRKVSRADGATVYRAQIVIKKNGEIVHRESKTFDKKKTADDWGKRREIEIQTTEVYKTREKLSVADVIAKYDDEFKPTGRTKRADLLALMKRDIGQLNVHTLSHKDLISHIRERNKTCQPQTANNDLIWLNTVISTMRGVVDIDTDMSIFDTARKILKKENLIAKSNKRTRRPTRKELWALSRHFYGTPMLHIMWFAIYSARRQGEITRLEWDDINHVRKTCLLRDMKDPRIKGKKKWFKIPAGAYKIIMRQPQSGRYIFSMKPKTVSTYFTRACKLLGIDDLDFHDLRHEATSRLFEGGLSIVQVMQVTLHCSLSTLQIYTNLDPGDLDI